MEIKKKKKKKNGNLIYSKTEKIKFSLDENLIFSYYKKSMNFSLKGLTLRFLILLYVKKFNLAFFND